MYYCESISDMTMQSKLFRTLLLILTFLVIMLLVPFDAAADGEDQCIKCHTSGRSLIKATREIADEFGDQILKSTESEGEG